MSLNQSMNISLGSMKNNQYALTVVAQNIANLNVEGYHRQRVEFTTNRYTTDCENVIQTIKGMNGASVSKLSDFIDKGVFDDLINSNSDANYYNSLADALGGLEDIANDLGDDGLNKLLGDFFSASSKLEQFPSDLSIRQQYVMAAQNVCEKFNDISKKYDNIEQEKFDNIAYDVDTINGLISDLAKINQEHVKNGQTAETQNQINNILQELSNYMDVSYDQNSNGTYNLYISGIEVVSGSKQLYTLQYEKTTDQNSPLKFSLKSVDNENYIIGKGVNDSFKSGSLRATLDFLNGTNESFANLNDYKIAINSAAKAFATELNKIQTYDGQDGFAASMSTDANGNFILEKSTANMLVSSDGGEVNAGNIKVNSEIINNAYLVAASRIKYNPDGSTPNDWEKAIGNSDNAVEITNLQNKKICSMGGGQNNATLSQFLINNAAKTGLDVKNIEKKASTYQDIADSAGTNFSNIVGVNVDEELSDMIKFQRAYEASAKLFSTINGLMETIISMV